MARMSALADEAARALLDDAEERLTGGLATAADRVAAASRGEAVHDRSARSPRAATPRPS